MRSLKSFLLLCIVSSSLPLVAQEQPWPPELRGATNGTVTLRSEQFLKVPDSVVAARK